MNQLQTFNFSNQSVRVVLKNGEPWWCAKDVCDIIGLNNGRQAVVKLDEDERDAVILNDAIGREQSFTVINESGLYNLILRSNKPEAKTFRKWVTSEVLPQIRKTGSYSLQIPKTLPEALRAYAAELEQKEALQKQIEQQAPKVALADACLTAKNSQTITQTAKVLGIGRNHLCEFLRADGVFYIHRGENLAYQKYIDRGLFTTKDRPIEHSDRFENHTQTLVTPKGLQWLEEKIRNLGGVKKVIEAVRLAKAGLN